MINEDEYLERLVAGIHAVSADAAQVRWNEKINGRQFDVVIRFRLGTLEYLVLVEVKNRSRRASASDIEAFIIKARDQQANKAVFVTVAGFQEGALTVARRHGIDLFTIAFDKDAVDLSSTTTRVVLHNLEYQGDHTPTLKVSDPLLTDVIEDALLTYTDLSSFNVPNEATQMNYYAEKTLLGDGRTLGDLMQTAPRGSVVEGNVRTEVISLPTPISITPPDEYFFPSGMLTSVKLDLVGRMSRIMSGNIMIEPTSFASPVTYTNVLTGETTQYSLDQLPLNTDCLVVGSFYVQMHPLRYFHCDAIQTGTVTWRMIESFQNGQFIRTRYTQDEKYGVYYIPVSDKITINRLKRRLADYIDLSVSQPRPQLKVSGNRQSRRAELAKRPQGKRSR